MIIRELISSLLDQANIREEEATNFGDDNALQNAETMREAAKKLSFNKGHNYAQWIEDNNIVRCSHCESVFDKPTTYCSSCGADMSKPNILASATREEIIKSLIDQANDKDQIANNDEYLIFYNDAEYLRAAVNMLKADDLKLKEISEMNKRTKTVPICENFGLMLNCALRYTLGRETYAPHSVMIYCKPLLPYLSERTLEVMQKDIEEAAKSNSLGDPRIDAPKWLEFLDAIKTELAERNNLNE